MKKFFKNLTSENTQFKSEKQISPNIQKILKAQGLEVCDYNIGLIDLSQVHGDDLTNGLLRECSFQQILYAVIKGMERCGHIEQLK